MKRLMFTIALLACGLLSLVSHAQQPLTNPAVSSTPSQSTPTISKSTEVTSTPEMWFYEQERLRYENPGAMSRARAEYEANQRQQRMAALKWYGYSNSRPMAGTDANAGVYAPRWVGNTQVGTDWSAVSPAPVTYGGVSVIDRVRRW